MIRSKRAIVRQTPKSRWKIVLNVATLVALLVLVFAVRHQLAETLHNLHNVNIWALLLLVPIEWANYDAQARLYRSLFRVVGSELSYGFLFRTALELNFINNVFPSGGVSGISYFGVRMRSASQSITAGKATVVQMMKLMLLFLSFEALLISGLLFMAIGGRVNSLVILVASSLSTLMVVGTFGFVLIIGSERRIRASFVAVTRFVNALVRLVQPHRPEAISLERALHAVEELHGNYKRIESQYRELKWPLFWALMANIFEVGAVYIVYVAFGHWVNAGSVILAYSIANFAGLISVLPGGVGVYEALMTAVLAVAGVPAALSLPVTVMYRVLNMGIQLPPGYYYYHKRLRAPSSSEPAHA